MTFDAASVAPQDATAGGANAAATQTTVTFSGSASVTIPAGGDATSDLKMPFTYQVPGSEDGAHLIAERAAGGSPPLAQRGRKGALRVNTHAIRATCRSSCS
ncbi:hypothetical protein [Streptomyces sp. NPDC018610]|uniref:hypothetical protein n=1 Tax=Streptomyces sp. NPDC018610 TaxID=3365049 RepID=UPI00379CAB0B